MKQFTKSNIAGVRKDIESVLEVAAEQLGINLSLGGLRYSDGEFSVKLTGIAATESGEMINPYEKAYTDMQELNPDTHNLGHKFSCHGETFTIAGWKPRGRKYKLLGKGSNGKLYKFSGKYCNK